MKSVLQYFVLAFVISMPSLSSADAKIPNCEVYVTVLNEGTQIVNDPCEGCDSSAWVKKLNKINTILMISQSPDYKQCEKDNANVRASAKEFLATVEQKSKQHAIQSKAVWDKG